MADYKSLEPYAKYLAGDPDKPQHRHPRLPAYEANVSELLESVLD